MTKRNTGADDTEQLALVPITPPADDVGTRHSEMLEAAIADARERGLLETLDEALVSIARANARALDSAEALGKKGGYLIANLTGPYREVLEQLRMTPKDRNNDADNDLTAALAALSTPSVRDT